MQVVKGREKGQKIVYHQVVEIRVGKNHCVLLGWQTQQLEKGKSRWNGSVSTAVSGKGRGESKSWGRRIRWTESISVFNSSCASL